MRSVTATHVFVPAVMEHIELAGVHSGDSACVLPSQTIPGRNLRPIKDYTETIAKEMHVQRPDEHAVRDRGRQGICIGSKSARIAARFRWYPRYATSTWCSWQLRSSPCDLTRQSFPDTGSASDKNIPHYGVKEAVFPFNMFPEVDPVLGPEMRSTGEVLGMADTFGEAFFKAQEATQTKIPLSGTALISISDRDKSELPELARSLHECGFKLIATGGTCDVIEKEGIPVTRIFKLSQGRPNVLDVDHEQGSKPDHQYSRRQEGRG